ncbi:MAG TPA: GxxExxY protein [Bacteroidota bacterium]|nr:GxxExxY protein [Bacteroidota bacterium]
MIQGQLSNRIIGAFYAVYHQLEYGFLEKVYENALVRELRKKGMKATQQKRIDVYYDGQRVGEYFADIVVEDSVVLELKAAEGIAPEHEAQLINYLKASNIELGLLFNFGVQPQFIRRVFTNGRKSLTTNDAKDAN